MSNKVAETMPIGPVQVYWNDIRIGSPKSAMTLRYSEETVQYGLEDSPVNVGSYKTKEVAEIDVVIADLKMDQLRYVYASAADYDDRTSLLSVGYVASSATVFRFKEDIRLSGTTAVAVAQAGYETGTVKVYKSDLSETYTAGTDYTATGTDIQRIDTGGIDTGETVIVHYNQSATAAVAFAGGKLADFEAPLRLVHILDTGKSLQLYCYRAKKVGASDIAISMADAFGGVPMTFHLIADMTQAPGKQLFYWSKEA